MFKTFPEFSRLTLDYREEYESYIKDFPPIGDLAFASLMTWWDALDNISICEAEYLSVADIVLFLPPTELGIGEFRVKRAFDNQ